MKQVTVNKEQLKMLLNNVDELSQYVNQLIKYAYRDGYDKGFDDGYNAVGK